MRTGDELGQGPTLTSEGHIVAAHARCTTVLMAGCAIAALALACSSADRGTGPSGPVSTVTVRPESTAVVLGGTATLTATARDAGGTTLSNTTFFWSSSDTGVASVDQNGHVSARTVGTTQIAASASGVSGVATIAVVQSPVTSVVVAPSRATLRVGTTLQLSDTVQNASGALLPSQSATWTSDNESVATVDAAGLVVARASGTAHITATVDSIGGTSTITVTPVPTASIVVTPPAPALYVGQTTQLTATPEDSAGDPLGGRSITWTSLTPSVAKVSTSGLVTGVSTGSAIVEATSGGVTGTDTVTVTSEPFSSVVLSPATSSLFLGQTEQITAVVTNATGQPVAGAVVTYASTNTAVATVSPSSGKVTAVGVGVTTITGTSEGKTGEAAVAVSQVPVGSVTLAPKDTTVAAGARVQMRAVVIDSLGHTIASPTLSWSSTPTGRVSSSGVVEPQAVDTGSAITVTATSGTKSGTALVNVSVPPPPAIASVTVQPNDTTISATQTAQMRVTVTNTAGQTVSSPVAWSSRPAGRVSASGLVTPQAGDTGTAISIIATSGGVSGTATVNVATPPAPTVASVAVAPTDTTITASQSAQMRVTVTNTAGQTVSSPTVGWSSTPAGRVSSSGLVTPQPGDTGTAITVTASSGGKAGTATVNVAAPPPPGVASVTVAPSDTTITTSQTAQMRVTVTNTNGQTVAAPSVTWSSAPAGRVSPTGLVTPQPGDSGTAITVTAASGGRSGTATVNVTSPPPPPPPPGPAVASVTVLPADTTIASTGTAQMRTVVLSTAGDTLASAPIAWTSQPGNRVSNTGLVTPSPGDAGKAITITATSGGQSGSTDVNVSSGPPGPPPGPPGPPGPARVIAR